MTQVKSLWEYIHKNFRTCPNCGTTSKCFLFCMVCLDELEIEQAKSRLLFGNCSLKNQIVAAYTWTPDQNRVLSMLISKLKNHLVGSDWDVVVERLFLPRQVQFYRMTDEKLIFVPVPNGHGRPDHALAFAQSLARNLGGEFAPLLRRQGSTKQHTRSKWERSRIEFEKSEMFTGLDSGKQKIVIVDDVLTTGETARAAIDALEAPSSAEVWVIARRSLATK